MCVNCKYCTLILLYGVRKRIKPFKPFKPLSLFKPTTADHNFIFTQ